MAALEQGLAELGYVGGRNILIVNRNAGQQVSRLPELATELVRSGVDVIVTSVNPATLAAKKATATIPIVMAVGVEPVAAGLVASLAKPGANVTGLTFDVDATQLAGKRLEILKELLPSVSRVAVLWNPGYGPGILRFKGTEEAGRRLGITIVSVQLAEGSDADRAFTEIRRAPAEAVTSDASVCGKHSPFARSSSLPPGLTVVVLEAGSQPFNPPAVFTSTQRPSLLSSSRGSPSLRSATMESNDVLPARSLAVLLLT